jgi:hypothetical protein
VDSLSLSLLGASSSKDWGANASIAQITATRYGQRRQVPFNLQRRAPGLMRCGAEREENKGIPVATTRHKVQLAHSASTTQQPPNATDLLHGFRPRKPSEPDCRDSELGRGWLQSIGKRPRRLRFPEVTKHHQILTGRSDFRRWLAPFSLRRTSWSFTTSGQGRASGSNPSGTV